MPKNNTITPDRTNRLPPPKNRRMPSMRMSGGGGAGGTDRCVAGAGTKAVELTMVGGAAARGGICTRVESSMRGAGWAGGAATGAARDRLRLRRLRSSSSERKDARMELKSAMAKPATAPSSESRKCDPAFPRVAPANAPMMASTIRMTGSIENSPCKPIPLSAGPLCMVERSVRNSWLQGSTPRSGPDHAVIPGRFTAVLRACAGRAPPP